MSRRYFGTDGIRGRVGKSPMTVDFIMHLGDIATDGRYPHMWKPFIDQKNTSANSLGSTVIGRSFHISPLGCIKDSI